MCCSKPDMSDSATVLEAFRFIESAAAEFSDEDEDEDSGAKDRTILDMAAVRQNRSTSTSAEKLIFVIFTVLFRTDGEEETILLLLL